VKLAYQNVQDQQRLTWPATFVVARAYLDQTRALTRLAADRIGAARSALAGAELGRAGRRATLTTLATSSTAMRGAPRRSEGPHAGSSGTGDPMNARLSLVLTSCLELPCWPPRDGAFRRTAAVAETPFSGFVIQRGNHLGSSC